MGLSRREFLKRSMAAGAAAALPLGLGAGCPALSSILDPRLIQKYSSPLPILPAMPMAASAAFDYYEIAIRQFRQQILPTGWPGTSVWGYGSIHAPSTFSYPSFTLEARWEKPLRVKWINQLMNAAGNFLPHLLPVDQTLHWANPPGGATMRDMETQNTDPYLGPVPMVTHLHGGHSKDYSDGYPEAWYLPAAANIPMGYARTGTWYDTFKAEAEADLGQTWTPGSAVFEYLNDQRATTLWFHDHSLGITRSNVYAGTAGFYLIRGGPDDLAEALPGPAPRTDDLPGTNYFEIPVLVQDRSFRVDGSLFYPDSREFFANAIVVNGRTWPFQLVEPRRYRFRWLNCCNSRFLFLKIVAGDPTARPASATLPFWQIGADGGFLPEPLPRESFRIGPGERVDTIVDFTDAAPGTAFYVINEGPDEPFGGGEPGTDFAVADPGTTGQIMKFIVTPLSSVDTSVPPDQLTLPSRPALGTANVTRDLTVNEVDSDVLAGVGPRASFLGTVADGSHRWKDAVTENPKLGDVEVWNIHNTTEDAHPIHIHQVQFEVLGRTGANGENPTPPEAGEDGLKDTLAVYPDGVTTVKAVFDLPGRYVWHCHILEHEDNEMMRPFHVGPVPPEP